MAAPRHFFLPDFLDVIHLKIFIDKTPEKVYHTIVPRDARTGRRAHPEDRDLRRYFHVLYLCSFRVSLHPDRGAAGKLRFPRRGRRAPVRPGHRAPLPRGGDLMREPPHEGQMTLIFLIQLFRCNTSKKIR